MVAWLTGVDKLAHKADADGNHSAACYYFAVALEPCAGFIGPDNVNTLNIEQKLALNLFNNDRQPDAQRLFNDILAKCARIQEKGKLDDDYKRVVKSIVGCCCEYARGFFLKKDYRNARIEYERVLKTSEKLLGATEETSKIKFNLSQAKAKEKEVNEKKKQKPKDSVKNGSGGEKSAQKASGGKSPGPSQGKSNDKKDNASGKKNDCVDEKKKKDGANEKKKDNDSDDKKKNPPGVEKKENRSPSPNTKPKAPKSPSPTPSPSPSHSPSPAPKPKPPPTPPHKETQAGSAKKTTTTPSGQHLQVPTPKPRSRSVGGDSPRKGDDGGSTTTSPPTKPGKQGDGAGAGPGQGGTGRPRSGSDAGVGKNVIRGKLFDAMDSGAGGGRLVKLDQLSSAEMKKSHKSVEVWSTGRLRQTHGFFEKRRSHVEYAPDKAKDHEKDKKSKTSDRSKRRVRIAILDTGVDLTHPEIAARKHRIQETLCAIPGLKDRGAEDTCGHGTCATLATMQIAPEADVYVARVFRGTQDVVVVVNGDGGSSGGSGGAEEDSVVAKAIMHAVDEWEVDIISLSFGFPKPVGAVERALRHATERDVLVFAAASNDGANAEISRSWPARDDTRVFCVHATDRDGASWARNPPRESAVANFATVGVDVLSAWKDGVMVGKTGTSVATPVAAATAALFIDFARLPRLKGKNIENVDKVASFRGMRLLLLASSVIIGEHNFRYIKPWHMFALHEYDYDSIRLAIQTELRKL